MLHGVSPRGSRLAGEVGRPCTGADRDVRRAVLGQASGNCVEMNGRVALLTHRHADLALRFTLWYKSVKLKLIWWSEDVVGTGNQSRLTTGED